MSRLKLGIIGCGGIANQKHFPSLKANADKEIKLTFKAKIRPNANLAAYVVGDKVVINNQASYNVDLPDNPGVHKDSNIVPVTPPSPEKPEI